METLLHFSTLSETPGAGVALFVFSRLDDAGIDCTKPEEIGSAWRMVARVGTARVPLLVGMVGGHDRWFVSIGSGLMPVARLIGAKDADPRAQVTAAILTILEDTPHISDIELQDAADPPS